MRRFVLFCFVLAATAAFASARAQSLDEVLARHYEAMGGLDATRAVEAVRIEGTMHLPVQGVEVAMTMYQARPNKVRVENAFGDVTIVQAYDGARAWMINPMMGSDEPVEIPGSAAASLQDTGDFDGPLYDYAAKGHTVTLAGREELDGRAVYRIDVLTKNGGEQVHYLDAETYLPVRKVTQSVQQGQEVEIVQRFDDYRPVGAIVAPYAIETQVGGQTMARLQVARVTVNPTLDAGLFAMPGD